MLAVAAAVFTTVAAQVEQVVRVVVVMAGQIA
jgi:hypothetical protein